VGRAGQPDAKEQFQTASSRPNLENGHPLTIMSAWVSPLYKILDIEKASPFIL